MSSKRNWAMPSLSDPEAKEKRDHPGHVSWGLRIKDGRGRIDTHASVY
jgi:hypothetical protein